MRNYFISMFGGRRTILFGAVVFAVVAVGLHSAEGQTQPSAPDSLKPPAGEHLRVHAHASGQQIYTCDGSKWILSGPDAKLFDEAGQQVGSHFAGPTWQWSDGSRVTAKPIANATPDPESIPWLLLTATSHTGDGVMKNVSSVQRLQTKGGKAPATGCDESHKGAQARVPYTADYYFYVP
jgi:FtsP/CotA-like multicopper oxidase with cupredoxin domain